METLGWLVGFTLVGIPFILFLIGIWNSPIAKSLDHINDKHAKPRE